MGSDERRDLILSRARALASTGDYDGWEAVAIEIRDREGLCAARRVLARDHVSVEVDRLCSWANGAAKRIG